MEKTKFTKEQVDFIIKNYSKEGVKYCAQALKLKEEIIRSKANRLGLKLSSERFNEQQTKKSLKTEYPKLEKFMNLEDPKIIYLMGLMWADGYLHDKQNRFELSIDKNDFIDIEKIVKEIGDWRIYERNRKNRKPCIIVGCYSKPICDLMRDYGFMEKSLK